MQEKKRTNATIMPAKRIDNESYTYQVAVKPRVSLKKELRLKI